MTPSQETAELAVTRDDATRFLENAVRNWSHVPPLSNDDLDDVAGALKGFLAKRRAALDSAQQPAPVGDAALRKATDELAAFATLLERPPLDDVEIEAQLAARIAASIRALLATPPSLPAQAWLPIETAPKDGAHFLACDARRPYDQWWGFNQQPPYVVHYWDAPDEEAGFYLSNGCSGDADVAMTPTHWMPLPATPPAQDQKGDGE